MSVNGMKTCSYLSACLVFLALLISGYATAGKEAAIYSVDAHEDAYGKETAD
jgi:hypothetical protein